MSNPLDALSSIASSFEKLLSQSLSAVQSSLSSILSNVDQKLGQSNVITADINAFKSMVVAGRNLESDLKLTISKLQTLIQTGVRDVEQIISTAKTVIGGSITSIEGSVSGIVTSVESITQNLPSVIQSTASQLEKAIVTLFDDLRKDAETVVKAIEDSPILGQLESIVNAALVSASQLQQKITSDINALSSDIEALFADGVARIDKKLDEAVREIDQIKREAENAGATLVADTNRIIKKFNDTMTDIENKADLLIGKLNISSSLLEVFLQPLVMILACVGILIFFKMFLR